MSLQSILKRSGPAIAIAGLLGFSGPLLNAFAPLQKSLQLIKPKEEELIQILFTNVNIFDGFSPELQNGMSVLVENNFIKEVGKSIKKPEGAFVVDGKGRTMTPGLIDMHTHTASL